MNIWMEYEWFEFLREAGLAKLIVLTTLNGDCQFLINDYNKFN